MLFSFLLWLMALRIKLRLFFVSIFHKALFTELKTLRLGLQIQSKDRDIVRSIMLDHGKVSSTARPLSDEQKTNPHLIVSFAQASEAPTIFKTLKNNKEQIFNFIQEQKILIEGDMSVLQTLFALKEKMEQQ